MRSHTTTIALDDPPVHMLSAVQRQCVRLGRGLLGAMDRRLGYFGKGRYVYFYYEARGEEVVWNDGRSYGFGTGGWMSFLDHVQPLAARHGMDLRAEGRGPGHQAPHVLLLDRRDGTAYLVSRQLAESLVTRTPAPERAGRAA